MTISKEFIDKIRENPRLRQRLAFEHPFWFALLYLPHHFTDSIAPVSRDGLLRLKRFLDLQKRFEEFYFV